MRRPLPLIQRRRMISPGLGEAAEALQASTTNYLPIIGPTPAWVAKPSYFPLLPVGTANWFVEPPPSNSAAYHAAQSGQLSTLPRGAPPSDVKVMPVWDSRMVNMRDALIPIIREPAWPGTTLFTYPVPAGYTFFLRGFRYEFDPQPGAGALQDFRVTLLVDEMIVPDFVNLPFGIFMAAYQETFVIANQLQNMTLQLTISDAGPFVTDAVVYLYGHLRQTDGRPANYNVGEVVKPSKVIVEPPKPEPPPAAPAAAAQVQCGPGEQLVRGQLPDGSIVERCGRVLGFAPRR